MKGIGLMGNMMVMVWKHRQKGSRYRGHYKQGLSHGIGVYRFYTGDVYAGEWPNG